MGKGEGGGKKDGGIYSQKRIVEGESKVVCGVVMVEWVAYGMVVDRLSAFGRGGKG